MLAVYAHTRAHTHTHTHTHMHAYTCVRMYEHYTCTNSRPDGCQVKSVARLAQFFSVRTIVVACTVHLLNVQYVNTYIRTLQLSNVCLCVYTYVHPALVSCFLVVCLPQVLELPKETFITALHWYPSQVGGARRSGASELCALGTTNGEEGRGEEGR